MDICDQSDISLDSDEDMSEMSEEEVKEKKFKTKEEYKAFRE